MPDIYQAGAMVPDFKGTVRGAVTLILHQPQDVDALLALCELAGTPPEDPMHAVYRELSTSGFDSKSWLWWKRRLPSRLSSEVTQQDPAPIDRLTDVLTLAKEIWEKEKQIWPKEENNLALSCSIADPSAPGYPEFEIETDVPMFALRPGSLTAAFLKRHFKAALFSIGLFNGGGATAFARAENLVERMRQEALAATTYKLPSLLETTPADLADDAKGDGKMLLVFVHGLLSTDAGTFDELINRLVKDPFVVTGFPHNTLGKIQDNALDLARAISAAINGGPNFVGLVCHSRGGLVARMAAEYLYQEDRKTGSQFWKTRLRICVTFGTPHLGSDLAESPEEFIGTFAAQASLRATRKTASLLDVLAYRAEHDGFPGIEDLKPEGDFLRKLQDQEQGVSPNIHVVAVGGRAPDGIKHKLADRVFGKSEHDLIVRLSSSLPNFLPAAQRSPANCDHFGYFESSQSAILDNIAATLREAAKPDPAATTSLTMPRIRYKTSPQSPA
jgi:hypothetical protein